MDKTPQEIEAIYAKFEKIGEKQVRINLDTHKYGDASGKKALARFWLKEQTQIKKDNIKLPWYQKPLGIVLLMVIAGLVVAVVVYWSGLN